MTTDAVLWIILFWLWLNSCAALLQAAYFRHRISELEAWRQAHDPAKGRAERDADRIRLRGFEG